MKINRSDLQKQLLKFAIEGNGIIVGGPGSGKTYSLAELASDLDKTDIPHLTILVDRLGNASQTDISSALEIDVPLFEKLKNEYFNKEKPGIVLIDGFDAARSAESQGNLLALIKDLTTTLKGGWNVLVSVRSFDARKSKDLLKIFPDKTHDTSAEYRDLKVRCRHFSIPILAENEILSLDEQIPGLSNLYKASRQEFKSILSVPFNLWLLSRLKISDLDFTSVASETQLLALFWDEYVSSSSQSEQKEHILREATKLMINEYSLTIRKEKIYQAGLDEALKGLFSDEILKPTTFTGQSIAFSHNILFDYAVSVLAIDDSPENLTAFLIQDPPRSLFLRPSLTYYYTGLWFHDRKLFWKSFWTLLSSTDTNLKLFARLVPAAVAVMQISKIEDFDDVLSPPKQFSEISIDSIVRIFQAYDSFGGKRDNIWSLFLEKLSENPKKEYVWYIAKIAEQILQRAISENSDPIIASCGKTGRQLINWIWSERHLSHGKWLDGVGADFVLPIIMQTISTNVTDSEILLKKVLSLVKEPNFPIRYIYRLADSIADIWPTSPEFVEDIYRTVFGYEEKSKEETSFGTPVLPLLSNRKQDFEMCHYHLTRLFPDFIKEKPINAAKAAIDCLNAFIWQKHIERPSKKELNIADLNLPFKFLGKEAQYIEDYSCIWDGKGAYREEELKLASSLFSFLEQHKDNKELLEEYLDILSEKALFAFWWKRLLRFGYSNPEIAVDHLFELIISEPIVGGMDTQYEAIELIHKIWDKLTSDQRRKFEDFLMLLKPKSEEKQKYLKSLQEKVISKLPLETLGREDSKKLKSEISLADKTPVNSRPYEITTGWGEYSDDDYLKEQGTDTSAPEIKILKEIWTSLSEFNSKFLNGVPESDQTTSVLEKIKLLYSKISPTPITEDKPALTKAWTELSSSAEVIARSKLVFGSDEYLFIKKMLIECASHSEPTLRDNAEERFTSPGYSPLPRNEAAQGLPWLARLGESSDILTTIKQLGSDPVPSVRYLVSREVWRLKDTSPDFLWDFLLERAKAEKNGVVLSALSYSLGQSLGKDESRISTIASHLFEKLAAFEDSSESAKAILDILVGLYLFRENSWAQDTISKIIKEPSKYPKILHSIVFDFLRYLTSKTQEKNEAAFNKAKDTLSALVASLWKEIREIYKSSAGVWTDQNKGALKTFYSPSDEVITRLYFASDVSSNLRKNDKVPVLTDEQRKKYYLAIRPLLFQILDDALNSNGGALFAPTAHHFMELLVGVLPYDVSGVLKMSADLAAASEGTGYSLDSMAIKEVVSLTETILADHRHELRTAENIGNLLKLLDVFAKTGWTEALKLVWRLDEIYR